MRNSYLLKELKNMGVNHIENDDGKPIQKYRALYKDMIVSWLVKNEGLQFAELTPWLIHSMTPKNKIVTQKKYFHVSTLKNFEEFKISGNPNFFNQGAHLGRIAELVRYLKNK